MEITYKKSDAEILRQKAEEILKRRLPKQVSLLTESEIFKLIHELEVHQIELEMQHAELMQAKESISQKYAKLYDSSPSAYYTFSKAGDIIELNLAGAKILGKDRSKLVSSKFGFFVSDDTKPSFNFFLEEIFKNQTEENCEVKLDREDEQSIYVHLTGIAYEDQEQCFVTATDISDRVQAEIALKNTLSLNNATLQSIHSGILVVNHEGKVIKSNSRFAEIWHIPENIISSGDDKILIDFILEQLAEPEAFIAKVTELYQKPEEESIDKIYFKDKRIFERISKPIFIENEPKGRVWSFLDITNQAIANEKLKASEEKYRMLINLAPDAFFQGDEVGNFIDVNHSAVNITGYSLEELLKMNMKDLFTEAILTNEPLRYDLLLKGETIKAERELIRKDGNIIFVEMNSKLMPDYTFQSFFRDITERKHAEKELQIAKQSYKDIFNSITEAIYILDDTGTFIDVNTGAEKMYGYDQGELIGQSPFTVAAKGLNNLDEIQIKMQKVAETGCTDNFDFWAVRKNSEIFPKEVIVNQGKYFGKDVLIATARDVTERKLVEEEIKYKNNELLKLIAEKDKFFSIIAHDLRSPFNGFLGLTQLMAEELPTMTIDQLQKIAVSIRNSASNLFNLLENLLKWSRMQQGLIPFTPLILELSQQIKDSTEIILEYANKKNIDLIIDIQDNSIVFADKNMLQTIVRNLVSNAVKFTPKGGKIKITAKSLSSDMVEVSINDTGIGMKKEFLENIFRLDTNTNREGTEGEPSTGLGLLLCKEFVEKHSGKIWVESEEGKGSCFIFTLPLS